MSVWVRGPSVSDRQKDRDLQVYIVRYRVCMDKQGDTTKGRWQMGQNKMSLFGLAKMVHLGNPAPAREAVQVYYVSPEVVETEDGFEVGVGVFHRESTGH